MDDRTRTLIVSALVLIIILALIGGAIFYIGRIVRSKQSSSVLKTSPQPSVVISSPSPEATLKPEGTTLEPNTKNYKGAGFEIFYPKSWGLLTCKNSKNFEFDPKSSTDQLNVLCDAAQKPVTVLVGGSNCPLGKTVDKGGVTFTKNKEEVQDGVIYTWCTKTLLLEISHRVSKTGQKATSTQDFSSQIEEMISKIRFGTNS